MEKTLIAQGAEARVYRDGEYIIKERFAKEYRLKDIDSALRKQRTKREGKVIEKLSSIGFPAPKLIELNEEKSIIKMEKLAGEKLRDVLHNNHLNLSKEMGLKVGVLHNNGIIHGDLTTSNMILNKEIYFIDFGLSFFSEKTEDKAVDLHLLKRALESKHYNIFDDCFKSVLDGYKETTKDYASVFNRLDEVEKRGRNKH